MECCTGFCSLTSKSGSTGALEDVVPGADACGVFACDCCEEIVSDELSSIMRWPYSSPDPVEVVERSSGAD